MSSIALFPQRDPAGPAVALVQDALPSLGGAERVLTNALGVFPRAPIYTLVFNRQAFVETPFAGHEIHTSFLNRLPGVLTNHRSYVPLFPLAVEQFDLRSYDLILSFSYAVAHGVMAGPDQLHLSYTYTPLRQAWSAYHAFLEQAGLRSGPKAWLVKILLHYLRAWDVAASNRVDHFLAVSDWVARGIWRAYRRPAEVLYPPVEVDRFQPHDRREDFYITVARLEPHKQVALVVEAFTRLGYPLVVVGDGSQRKQITRQVAELPGANVHLMGRQPDTVVQDLLGRAKAFVLAAEEDFGIAAVEAQAAGCPVIAFGHGGARETVIEGRTGIFFQQQSVDSLANAVRRFERERPRFELDDLRNSAERFDRRRFQRRLAQIVEREWDRFKKQGRNERAPALRVPLV